MLRLALRPRLPALTTIRPLSTTPIPLIKPMPPRPPPLPESSFTEAFLCGTGPGGQKINKTSSAVQLKHLETGLVLKVQATRSRSQNRKIARMMLAERVQDLECRRRLEEATVVGEGGEKEGVGREGVEGKEGKGKAMGKKGDEGKSRLMVVAETKSKRKKSGEKKRRRKYRELEEKKMAAEAEAAGDMGEMGMDGAVKAP